VPGNGGIIIAVTSGTGGEVVIDVAGGVDCGTAAELGDCIEERWRDERPPVAVNLERVTFFDAAALGALIGARSRVASDGGRVRVVGASRAVRRLLDVTHTAGILCGERADG